MNEIFDPDVRGRATIALMRVGHLVEDRIEAAFSLIGLSVAKARVLDHLVREGQPVPLSQLADLRNCARSNMTQLVDRLEAEGLVRRTSKPEDRRIVLAELTAEGERRYREAQRILVEQEEALAASYGDDELQALLDLLVRVEGALRNGRPGVESGAAAVA